MGPAPTLQVGADKMAVFAAAATFTGAAFGAASAYAASYAAAYAAHSRAIKTARTTDRAAIVERSFPYARAHEVKDFFAKLAPEFAARGFTRDTTIALAALCRDEVSAPLREAIDSVFGDAFNAQCLGGAIMLGKIGMGAFMHHSPTEGGENGRERYAFFAFAHAAVDSRGQMGAIQREGRHACSNACGALIGALGRAKGMKDPFSECPPECVPVDRLNPEFTFLCARLDDAMAQPGAKPAGKMDLSDMTKLSADVSKRDLEELIAETVDTDKSDYCVVTGIHVHNWAPQFGGAEPNLEFVVPTACYSVVRGCRVDHHIY